MSTQIETESEVIDQVDEPGKYGVFLLNDDYSTMEFVIEVLVKFFKKNPNEAHSIMLSVHEKGKGLAGIYSLEIAETKVAQVHSYARVNGHPLRCSLEKID